MPLSMSVAIKWIGDEGSHARNLTYKDLLQGFELFEHALDILYVRRDIKLKKAVKSINRRKGIARQAPKARARRYDGVLERLPATSVARIVGGRGMREPFWSSSPLFSGGC